MEEFQFLELLLVPQSLISTLGKPTSLKRKKSWMFLRRQRNVQLKWHSITLHLLPASTSMGVK
jgi:hypothetical protein